MKIKMTLSYDGSKFLGFQRQPKGKTVQNEVENALSKIAGKEILIKGAGRTDAGVHAVCQVVSFDIDSIDGVKKRLNELLKPYIVVEKLEKVNDDFHARLSAKKKEYIYKIYTGSYKSALANYYLEDSFKYDLSLMKEASRYMLGKHDFKNFVSGEKEDTVSTIYDISFNRKRDVLEIHFIGSHFYKYMVRNLVGALLEVGKYKIDYKEIKELVELKKERSLPTASPCGLYLYKIWYK